MNSNIVIVYHSGYGHTAKIAEAVAAGSEGTLLAIDAEGQLPEAGWVTLAQQHGMLWAGTGMMPSNAKNAHRDDVNYLSSFAGLATATPSDASVDEIPAGDLKTARLFGERIRQVTARLA